MKALLTLKHMAKDLDVDPYRLRAVLRNTELTPSNKRWKWDETEYPKALAIASKALQKPSSKLPRETPLTPSPSRQSVRKAAGTSRATRSKSSKTSSNAG